MSPYEEEEAESSAREDEKQTFIKVFLGGVMLGIFVFASFCHPYYSSKVHKILVQNNATLQIFQDRVSMAMQETQECLDNNDDNKLALAELKGKFAGTETLRQKQREMEAREADYEAELEALERRIRELKDETIAREKEYFELKDIIHRQTEELMTIQNERDILHERSSRLSEQQSKSRKQIKEGSMHIQELTRKVAEQEQQMNRIQKRTQERENFLAKEEYGNGPYYIQVGAKPRSGTQTIFSFILELASRKEMPHSVYTFLSLVSYQMLDGTTFRLLDSDVGSGLSLSMTMDAEVAFNQKRRALGMEEMILMFSEESAMFPCVEHSVGFEGLGPSLKFYTAPSGQGHSCFGTVYRGQESLAYILKLVTEGTAVDIFHLQHLDL